MLKAKVLIVGAGGLGCPVALYLACAGVGTIGIVDYDAVELGNLHRQVGHTESRQGVSKAESLAMSIKERNSDIQTIVHETMFTSDTAMEIVQHYDIVIDASDNVATRYLCNDCCILAGKPLVSGSALKWDGQLTVYNYGPTCPCYRCIFPTPPPADTVTKCSDGGVLGPIVGVIGSMQALEAIKIISKVDGVLAGRLVIYDGQQATFKTVRLRTRRPNCVVCGDAPTITQLIDYTQFCQSPYSESSGKAADRIDTNLIVSCKDYHQHVYTTNSPHILLDVRPKIQFDICSIPNSINIPVDELNKSDNINKIDQLISHDSSLPSMLQKLTNQYHHLILLLILIFHSDCMYREKESNVVIKHIRDGLLGWSDDIDPSFPIY
ncbi:molybdenum cofactor synthesis 3 [Cavenderia fasciculata]|uniref:Molybdenum cofactor synthesis 3 n=1 Tax=Cavenderia fasciculata TaxID=261658 RepID=F4PTQ9_CACFS|nr:molybdenum cofactor synthesis 3 [Cavenderia fasciculata]EGG21729.1 molybdenum cofactor synthesis 3 [Cavenderia fasciculata]|eukprot:XP_004359579.1 molybdenum cofactor synthesis 3 [Cavenderia fasciculata]